MIEKYFVVAISTQMNGVIDKYLVCRRVAIVTNNGLEETNDRIDDPPAASVAFSSLDGWFASKQGAQRTAVEWDKDIAAATATGNITNGGNIYKKP